MTQSHPFTSLADLLAAEQTPNSEGYVIRFESGMRVKVKHAEYVRLHRILTGVSSKSIWEALAAGDDLKEVLDRVPDEFYVWVQETVGGLRRDFAAMVDAIEADHVEIFRACLAERAVDDPGFRKTYATRAVKSPHKAALFRRLDDRPYDDYVWKALRPERSRPFATISEDVG